MNIEHTVYGQFSMIKYGVYDSVNMVLLSIGRHVTWLNLRNNHVAWN